MLTKQSLADAQEISAALPRCKGIILASGYACNRRAKKGGEYCRGCEVILKLITQGAIKGAQASRFLSPPKQKPAPKALPAPKREDKRVTKREAAIANVPMVASGIIEVAGIGPLSVYVLPFADGDEQTVAMAELFDLLRPEKKASTPGDAYYYHWLANHLRSINAAEGREYLAFPSQGRAKYGTFYHTYIKLGPLQRILTNSANRGFSPLTRGYQKALDGIEGYLQAERHRSAKELSVPAPPAPAPKPPTKHVPHPPHTAIGTIVVPGMGDIPVYTAQFLAGPRRVVAMKEFGQLRPRQAAPTSSNFQRWAEGRLELIDAVEGRDYISFGLDNGNRTTYITLGALEMILEKSAVMQRGASYASHYGKLLAAVRFYNSARIIETPSAQPKEEKPAAPLVFDAPTGLIMAEKPAEPPAPEPASVIVTHPLPSQPFFDITPAIVAGNPPVRSANGEIAKAENGKIVWVSPPKSMVSAESLPRASEKPFDQDNAAFKLNTAKMVKLLEAQNGLIEDLTAALNIRVGAMALRLDEVAESVKALVADLKG